MSSEGISEHLPYFAEGTVVKGFGRGSSELGIPTANFPGDVIARLPDAFACGVYYGWACIDTLAPSTVYKMVMCVGWNPHYHNTVKTMETHIIHKFNTSFYGENLRILIIGYIRPMNAFDSLDALITAMNADIDFAQTSLHEPPKDSFLTTSSPSHTQKGHTTNGDVLTNGCVSTTTTTATTHQHIDIDGSEKVINGHQNCENVKNSSEKNSVIQNGTSSNSCTSSRSGSETNSTSTKNNIIINASSLSSSSSSIPRCCSQSHSSTSSTSLPHLNGGTDCPRL